MRLSPDDLVFLHYKSLVLNSTIVTTWALMLVMTVGSWLITRKLVTEVHISRWQGFLEIVVTTIEEQIKEVGLHNPAKYLGFLGTLFLFIAVSNLCSIIPGIRSADGFALDHLGAGDLGVCRRAVLRHRGPRVGRLPEVLLEADVDHVAVQHHQRAISHVCAGHPSVRQHHERDDDCRHLAHDHAPHLS